ncbi:Homeobox domain containing protein [Asbolus verrucosus]|uniref:Homeobox domain containing protein n=1 Tax=Asbolus verrucosus TaxID=1661398 RepID=A0A482VPJ5_ASBVE|nr:Homeobox domain containing protein [Asbolus verrucosus]
MVEKYLRRDRRRAFSSHLNLSEAQIKVWFWSRRFKEETRPKAESTEKIDNSIGRTEIRTRLWIGFCFYPAWVLFLEVFCAPKLLT